MKVTDIKQQVKRADRYSVFIDGKYRFSLSVAELSDLGIRKDLEISEPELSKLLGEAQTSLAKNNSLRFLSYRPRSLWEIETYLKRKKYAPEVIVSTISFLSEKNFIGDKQFAKQWVENRLLLKHVSVRQLKQELRQKKVSDETISEVLEEQQIDEIPIIKELIAKKRQQPKYRDDLKLMQFLARRGYSYDKIQIALGRRAE
jgi:regulatory protein